MDKWKAFQVGVVSGVVLVTGVEVLEKNPGDNPHTENETSAQDQPIGRAASPFAATTGPTAPFVNTVDGNERRQYRPNASAYYSSQEETGTPLPLLMLSLIR